MKRKTDHYLAKFHSAKQSVSNHFKKRETSKISFRETKKIAKAHFWLSCLVKITVLWKITISRKWLFFSEIIYSSISRKLSRILRKSSEAGGFFFANQRFIFGIFASLLLLTEVSPQPSAYPGSNPPGDWQSAVGWGDTGFEPGTAGNQSGALPLSYHASLNWATMPWRCR
jgi:hypothetical protein